LWAANHCSSGHFRCSRKEVSTGEGGKRRSKRERKKERERGGKALRPDKKTVSEKEDET
jgi:hypothetical protein